MADGTVGGISKTVEFEGYRFDLGGHRFYTKLDPVLKLWKEMLPEDFLTRPRLSRIYYNGRFFNYPLRADDVPGNKLLRSQIRTATAHHYGSVPGRTAIVEGYCDGFVIGGGVRETVAAGISSAMANMPFFLQMVGTGLTTTLALHLGAVLTHAQWPAITCHELYSHPLITQRPDVIGGYARVPEAPGLGVELDEAAVAKYRVEKADLSLPRRLVKYSRTNGVNVYFANNSHHTSQMWNYFSLGNQPLFERGVTTELVDDDGSPGFAEIHAQAQVAPVLTRA